MHTCRPLLEKGCSEPISQWERPAPQAQLPQAGGRKRHCSCRHNHGQKYEQGEYKVVQAVGRFDP